MNARENELDGLLVLMERAAEEASKAILASLNKEESARIIGRNPSSTPTRAIDKISEDVILFRIRESRVPLLVVTEEQGVIQLGAGPRYALIIDPLDGTTNALHSIPFFAVSLGLAELSERPTLRDMVAGLVRDVPRGATYLAVKGRGLRSPVSSGWKEERRVKGKPLISLYAYGGRIMEDAVLRILESSLVRTLGSVSLEMCMLAMGNIDAFVDIRNLSRVVDVAASLVILGEAGCLVSDPRGLELDNSLTQAGGLSLIAARSKRLHGNLVRMANLST